MNSLLKENGILERAIKNTFHDDNEGQKNLDQQIIQNAREIKQCEKLLDMLASQGCQRMIEKPELMEGILLEGAEVKKRTHAHLTELRENSMRLVKQHEQFCRFKQKATR